MFGKISATNVYELERGTRGEKNFAEGDGAYYPVEGCATDEVLQILQPMVSSPETEGLMLER